MSCVSSTVLWNAVSTVKFIVGIKLPSWTFNFPCHIFHYLFFSFPPPPVFLTHVLWRLGSKKSWWLRGCWTLRSDPDQEETLRMRSWQSCRRDKQSSKPWVLTTERASRSCSGENTDQMWIYSIYPDINCTSNKVNCWHSLLMCSYLTGWQKRRCANKSWGREYGCLTMRSWRDFDESWQPGRRNALRPRRRRTRRGKPWRKEKASSSYWMDRGIVCLRFQTRKQLLRAQSTAVCVMVNDSVYCRSAWSP